MSINKRPAWLKSKDEIAIHDAIRWLYRHDPKADGYTAAEIIKVVGPGGGRRPALKALTERGLLNAHQSGAEGTCLKYSIPKDKAPSNREELKRILFEAMFARGYGVGYSDTLIWNGSGAWVYFDGFAHPLNVELPEFPFNVEQVILTRRGFYQCMREKAEWELQMHAAAELGE